MSSGSGSTTPTGAASSQPSMSLKMESPPLIMYGPPNNSTGALASGVFMLKVGRSHADVQSLELRLTMTTKTKKPLHHTCEQCRESKLSLQTWTLINGGRSVEPGIMHWPFSYLIPGHFPATFDSHVGSIQYSLDATLKIKHSENAKKKPSNVNYSYSLKISRAILPGIDKTAIRIFPPTNLVATIILPNVFHPGSSHIVDMFLTGIMGTSQVNGINQNTVWKIRKLNWTLEENLKADIAPCANHKHKLSHIKDIKRGKNGVLIEEVRPLGHGELRSGWKSDFSRDSPKIEVEINISSQLHLEPCCDLNTIEGSPFDMPFTFQVSHNLVLEVIAVEEFFGDSEEMLPTGSARILRMNLPLKMTERSGLGVSWDEECPPTFDMVGAPPPAYDGTQFTDLEEQIQNQIQQQPLTPVVESQSTTEKV